MSTYNQFNVRPVRVYKDVDGYDVATYKFNKELIRERIEEDVKRFLEAGGVIKQIKMGESVVNIEDEIKSIKKHRAFS